LLRRTGIGVAILLIAFSRPAGMKRPSGSAGQSSWRAAPARAAYPHRRSIYPFSVIRGGAYSAAELDAAIRFDPAVAAHYTGFDRGRLRMEAAEAGRRVYVSYRVGDRMFWTRNRVALAPGELLLTDGRNQARARCGNRISDTPQQTTSEKAISEERLDHPEEEPSSAAALSQERTAPADVPFWLAPDIFDAPNLSSWTGPSGGSTGSDEPAFEDEFGQPGLPGFQAPFSMAPAAPPPGVVVIRGTPASGSVSPLGPFPGQPAIPLPTVALAVSILPETGTASVNWRDPGAAPPNTGLLLGTLPPSNPNEVVIRISSPTPVASWWLLTPPMPWLPPAPGGSPPTTTGTIPSGPFPPPALPGQPGGPFLPPGLPGTPGPPDSVTAVPEPSTAPVVLIVMAAAFFYRRKLARAPK
jgi:hypothetical protein